MARVAGQITLARQLLRAGVRARKTPQHLAMRMRIILRSARGLENLQIAAIDDLQRKLLEFIQYFNAVLAKPFKWTYAGKPLPVPVAVPVPSLRTTDETRTE